MAPFGCYQICKPGIDCSTDEDRKQCREAFGCKSNSPSLRSVSVLHDPSCIATLRVPGGNGGPANGDKEGRLRNGSYRHGCNRKLPDRCRPQKGLSARRPMSVIALVTTATR